MSKSYIILYVMYILHTEINNFIISSNTIINKNIIIYNTIGNYELFQQYICIRLYVVLIFSYFDDNIFNLILKDFKLVNINRKNTENGIKKLNVSK